MRDKSKGQNTGKTDSFILPEKHFHSTRAWKKFTLKYLRNEPKQFLHGFENFWRTGTGKWQKIMSR